MISLAVINVPIIEAFTNLVTKIALCILCIVFCKIISAVIIVILLLQNKWHQSQYYPRTQGAYFH